MQNKSPFNVNNKKKSCPITVFSSFPPSTIISNISQTQSWLMFAQKCWPGIYREFIVDYAGGDWASSHWVLTIIKTTTGGNQKSFLLTSNYCENNWTNVNPSQSNPHDWYGFYAFSPYTIAVLSILNLWNHFARQLPFKQLPLKTNFVLFRFVKSDYIVALLIFSRSKENHNKTFRNFLTCWICLGL